MIFTCQAILFDLDGVLVDSTAAVERVWRRWALEHDLDPAFVIEMAHGRRTIETVRIVAPELDATREYLRLENSETCDNEGVGVIPGSPGLLRSLPPERFTIVTSATRGLAAARLRYTGLPVPEKFITADDVINGKPDPEPYLKGAALLGFPPAGCVVFEDTPAGVQAAKAAGMRVVALTTTYPAAELCTANAVVRSCGDVHAGFDNSIIRLTCVR